MSWQHLIIGIDCGSTTGIAFYEPDQKKFILLQTTDFWGCYNLFAKDIHLVQNRPNIKIIVEDPKQLKVMYKKERYFAANRRNTIEKLAYNAGEVGRESELMAIGLQLLGYTIKRVAPSGAKPDAETFRRVTKYEGQTNQHVRDAGWLVYDLSWKWS